MMARLFDLFTTASHSAQLRSHVFVTSDARIPRLARARKEKTKKRPPSQNKIHKQENGSSLRSAPPLEGVYPIASFLFFLIFIFNTITLKFPSNLYRKMNELGSGEDGETI